MTSSDDTPVEAGAHLQPITPRRETFFTLHSELPREGPGEAADVTWAFKTLNIPKTARVCDAACGPGADLTALLDAASEGHVTGIDKMAHFVAAAQERIGDTDRATILQGDMANLSGQFDFIWCAGALYFLGIPRALDVWRAALAPGGAIAFSEPCFFTDTPSEAAIAFWQGHPVQTEAGIAEQIEAAGYDLVASRKVSDAAWESYFTPQEARIQELRPDAGPELSDVLDEATREIALWREAKADTGYLLCAVRPKA